MIYTDVVPPRKYKKFLSPREVVAGAPNTIKLTVKNIGKETFPGGKILESKVYMEFYIGMSVLTISGKVTPKLPTIQPNETFSIELKGWRPYCPGLWRISTKIKSKDNVKVKYYQTPKATPREDEWIAALYAVDRHQLDLSLLLKQLSSKMR